MIMIRLAGQRNGDATVKECQLCSYPSCFFGGHAGTFRVDHRHHAQIERRHGRFHFVDKDKDKGQGEDDDKDEDGDGDTGSR